ncbi:MAG: hypothetical protein IJR54_08540 [Oscillibacter sp.]|nr:hypothetical protein [Oscillibacter sp.]
MAEINFNYERAIQQAERLEVLSVRLKRVAGQDMERLLEPVQHLAKGIETWYNIGQGKGDEP